MKAQPLLIPTQKAEGRGELEENGFCRKTGSREESSSSLKNSTYYWNVMETESHHLLSNTRYVSLRIINVR